MKEGASQAVPVPQTLAEIPLKMTWVRTARTTLREKGRVKEVSPETRSTGNTRKGMRNR